MTHILTPRNLFLGLVLLLLLTAGQVAQADLIRLRYANFPPASTFPCIQMERWIEEVHAITDGKVHVDSFPAGALLDARSMLRGVMRGQADIGCFSTAYYAGAFPLSSVFELPLGFRSSEEASRILLEVLDEFQPQDLSKVKILTAFTSPPAQVMSSRPVTSLNDLQGLSLRASGILADEVALLGGKPVSMPQSEAPDAIQRGAVDGIFSSLDVVKDLNYAESCRYGLITDMSVYPFVVVMNRRVWNSLPPEIREKLDALAMPHAIWTGKYVDAHAREALEWGRKTYSIDYRMLDEAEHAEALRKVAPLIEAWKEKTEQQGLPASAILESIRAKLQ